MHVGLNLEYARSEELSLYDAMREAAEVGYRYVEPYVYSNVSQPVNSHLSLRTETPYHHVDTGADDARPVNHLKMDLGLEFSAVDAHASLLLPQIAVPYIRRAIEFAAEVECPIVMSDEGPVPEEWMTLDQAFEIMCVSLKAIVPYAQSHGVLFAVELHNALTARPDMLMKLLDRFDATELGVNFDTGNSFLAGNDPVEYLRSVANRVVHVHIKDIPQSQLHERGKVTGTRVGVAAGDGVVNLAGIVGVLAEVAYDGVFSIECDTMDQAAKSFSHRNQLLHTAIEE